MINNIPRKGNAERKRRGEREGRREDPTRCASEKRRVEEGGPDANFDAGARVTRTGGKSADSPRSITRDRAPSRAERSLSVAALIFRGDALLISPWL